MPHISIKMLKGRLLQLKSNWCFMWCSRLQRKTCICFSWGFYCTGMAECIAEEIANNPAVMKKANTTQRIYCKWILFFISISKAAGVVKLSAIALKYSCWYRWNCTCWYPNWKGCWISCWEKSKACPKQSPW